MFLTLLGLATGMLSGLLGIGGGLVIVPALVFLPPLVGLPSYSIHLATGIAAVQATLSGISSVWTHARKQSVLFKLAASLTAGSFVGGLLGGLISAMVPALALYIVFALTLLATLIFAWVIQPPGEDNKPENPKDITLPLWQGLLIGGGISFVAANVGIGGSVLLLPILIYFKGISTRLAIGTGAAFVVVTAFSGSIGKLVMNLVPFPDVVWVSVAAMLGGMVGARLSHKTHAAFLRRLLLGFVVLTLLRVLVEIYRQLQ